MEDVLDLYQQPHDLAAPVVCMDETPRQLIEELREPIAPAPGRPARIDYEYRRNGTANVFMFLEPLAGWRRTCVTEHRTAVDWALQIKHLLDVDYPDVRVVRLVMDNLNTHSIGSLYEAFSPAEARRLAARLEIHYTPKHGSWLNVAESELSVLSRQCLDRRIPDLATLTREVATWSEARNSTTARVEWHLTSTDARRKLKRLYPTYVQKPEPAAAEPPPAMTSAMGVPLAPALTED